MWDALPLEKAEAREAELKAKREFWGGVGGGGVQGDEAGWGEGVGGGDCAVFGGERGEVALRVQEEMAEGVPLHETGAGSVLEAGLRREIKGYEEEVERLREVLRRVEGGGGGGVQGGAGAEGEGGGDGGVEGGVEGVE